MERGYIFGNEYRDYVEKVIMTNKPHPEARPLGAFKMANGNLGEYKGSEVNRSFSMN